MRAVSRLRVLLTALVLALATAGGEALAQDGGPGPDLDGGVTAEAGPEGDGSVDAAPPAAPPILPERLPLVEAALGVEQVELGQVVPVTITIRTKQAGDRVHLREARTFGPFELLGRRREEQSGDEGPSERLELDLISFEVGQLEVPPIELLVVLADGQTGSVQTNSLTVRVTDPLGNEPDPEARPDHAPLPVLTTDRRALWIGGVLGALLLAALLGAAIGRLRGRKRVKPAPPPPPRRPPDEVAYEKLDETKRGSLLEEGEVKAFHVAVSEAIREYLGGRYGFDSLEMTTEELFRQLEASPVRGVTESELQVFLRETDMVKFAKWCPSDERSLEMLEQAYAIVRRTTEANLAHEIRASIAKTAKRPPKARQAGGGEEQGPTEPAGAEADDGSGRADRGGTDEEA